MANWATQKNPQKFTNLKGFDENDMMMMGVMQSQKPGFNDLIQNCDLPPPTKVFSGFSDNVTAINPINRKIGNQDDDDDDDDNDDKERKLGLLKALRLSQTRAREAEAKYAAITKEKDAISFAFVRDSMQIFAYKQFVRLLEFQVSQLQQQQQCGKTKQEETDDDDDDDDDVDRLTWLITMAFCFGIAGVGLAIGCKYFYC